MQMDDPVYTFDLRMYCERWDGSKTGQTRTQDQAPGPGLRNFPHARTSEIGDRKWPRAPPAFGTVGCWVHVDRLLTPDSSKSTVAPSVSARLVGFGTSTAAARPVDVDVKT